MFIDSRKLASKNPVKADICVVGGGLAGITLALEFLDGGHDVVLLESGGFEADDATTDLCRGKNIGRNYLRLVETRRRFWGGSGNAWAGLVAPLDAVDFEERSWVPHSGWPINREDLDPFYRRAHARLGLAAFEYAASPHATAEDPVFDFGDGAKIRSTVLQGAVGSRNLGALHRDAIDKNKSIRVHLHANVRNIALNDAGTAVDHLDVQVLDGPAFTVRARRYVLAAGGLENPRLLLASNGVHKKGVGNGNDLVGRFFMEHAHTNDQGFLLGSAALSAWNLYRRNRHGEDLAEHTIWAHLGLDPAVMRDEQVLNCHLVLLAEKVRRRKKKLKRAIPLKQELAAAIGSTDGEDGAPSEARKNLRFTFGTPSETAPNRDSRFTLSAESRDALGMPRIELRWKLSPNDKRSIRRTHEILAQEVGRAGLGRMQLTLSEDDDLWPRMSGGRHHMGTTRMADDPEKGVCNKHGQVHGVADLFVAGSSLFPTSGAAPPTLTVMALATRLADHLKEGLK